MYINEVKRDNETLKKISEFQSSIENLVSICFFVVFLNTDWPISFPAVAEGPLCYYVRI